MRNNRKSGDSAAQKSGYEKVFDDAHKRLRETGDLDVVRKIPEDEDDTKLAPIPFPYGGKGYNNWISS